MFVLSAGRFLVVVAYNGIVYRTRWNSPNGPIPRRRSNRGPPCQASPPSGAPQSFRGSSYFVKAGEFSIGEGNCSGRGCSWRYWQRAGGVAQPANGCFAFAVAAGAVYMLAVALWGRADLHAGVVAAIPLQHPVCVQLLPALAVFLAISAYYLVRLPGAQLPNRAWPC